jgi:hypothetical protein
MSENLEVAEENRAPQESEPLNLTAEQREYLERSLTNMLTNALPGVCGDLAGQISAFTTRAAHSAHLDYK